MNKKELTEADIRTKFITPALVDADGQKPNRSDKGPGDVDHLLPEYEKLLAQIAETRAELKAQLLQALTR